MRKNTDRLSKPFKRLDGAKFKAILTPAGVGTTNDNAAFRILFVREPSFVGVGDVVKTYKGEKIILMQHPDDSEYVTSFKAAFVAKVETWWRTPKIKDPVSGAMKDGVPTNMGPLYINFDMPVDMPVGVMSDVRYRFITGQAVMLGDKVGGKVVKTLYDVLGVKLGFAD
jgi:hypothetical protein